MYRPTSNSGSHFWVIIFELVAVIVSAVGSRKLESEDWWIPSFRMVKQYIYTSIYWRQVGDDASHDKSTRKILQTSLWKQRNWGATNQLFGRGARSLRRPLVVQKRGRTVLRLQTCRSYRSRNSHHEPEFIQLPDQVQFLNQAWTLNSPWWVVQDTPLSAACLDVACGIVHTQFLTCADIVRSIKKSIDPIFETYSLI